MIERHAAGLLRQLASGFPVVALTGPRQSGKTTLARQVFPDKPYFTLEDLETRQRVLSDPRQFFTHLPDGAVLMRCSVARKFFPTCKAWWTSVHAWGSLSSRGRSNSAWSSASPSHWQVG